MCTRLYKEVTGLLFSLCHICIYWSYGSGWIFKQETLNKQYVFSALDIAKWEFSSEKVKNGNFHVIILCMFWNGWIEFPITLRTCSISVSSNIVLGCDRGNQDVGQQIQGCFFTESDWFLKLRDLTVTIMLVFLSLAS